MINRPNAVEYIVLEASGVADPDSISLTFMDSGLQDRIRLDSVTCVVDADQVFAHEDHPGVEMLKLRQIGFADMVVLNKVDLAGPERTKEAREWIDRNFNRVRVVETNHCEVPPEILLSVGRFDPSQLDIDADTKSRKHECPDSDCDHDHHQTNHGDTFATWSYETDHPLSLEALREMVKRDLPASVYRCKGVIRVAEHPERRAVLQCVGRRTDLTLDAAWGEHEAKTQIVAIGIPDKLDADRLQFLFDGCIAGRERREDNESLPGMTTTRI